MRSYRIPLAGLLGALAICVAAPCLSATIFVNLGAPGPTHDGATWPNAFTTVQAGLSAAQPGDEVWVARGTYNESVILRAGVALYGGFAGSEQQRDERDITANPTVLRGSGSETPQSVVTIPPGVGPETVIDGFTITNGYGTTIGSFTTPEDTGPARYGGGIYCKDASPTITNNVITLNTAGGRHETVGGAGQYALYFGGGWGGGIYIENGSPIIRENTLSRNWAWVEGGGVACVNASPALSGNVICGNSADYPVDTAGGFYFDGKGGGLAFRNASGAVTGNTVSENYSNLEGGGVRITGGAVTLNGNKILRNGSLKGGGVWCDAGALNGNTIEANQAYTHRYEDGFGGGVWAGGAVVCERNTFRLNEATYGGGLYAESATRVSGNVFAWNQAETGGAAYVSGLFANNTILRNVAPTAGGIGITGMARVVNNIVALNSSGMFQESGTPATVSQNCLFDNTYMHGLPAAQAYELGGVLANLPGSANIFADPMLANPDFGNLHVQPGSPCLNAGDNSVVAAGAVDIDGQERIQAGTVDIGADESDGTVWPVGPPATIHVSTAGDDANDGSSWSAAKKTVQAGIDALASGGEVRIAHGVYNGRAILRPFTHLKGGFPGAGENATVLDGQALGSVVSVPHGAVGCALEDLTIRNGSGTSDTDTYAIPRGGGAWIGIAQTDIARCRIVNNQAYGGFYGDYGSGGGLYQSGGMITVTDSTISDNKCGLGTWGGGGAYCAGTFIIANCRITGNIVDRNHGGGLSLLGTGLVDRCVIADNTAGDGGGAHLLGNVTLANSLITGNIANQRYAVEMVTGSLLNNTIVGNKPTFPIAMYYDCAIEAGGNPMVNNIVAFNTAGVLLPSSTSALKNNDVFGNSRFDYSGGNDPTGQYGNVKVDPLFADRAGADFRLSADSPLLDAGHDDAIWPGSLDLDGRPRISGMHVDLGAYEFVQGGVVPYTFAEAAAALRVAAGLSAANAVSVSRLNAVSGNGVDVLDAMRIARKASGRDDNL